MLAMGVLLAGGGLLASGGEAPRFAVYRVDVVHNESAPPFNRKNNDPRNWHPYLTQEYLLATAVKLGGPVITEADIEDYCWNTQRVQLTAEGARKWNAQGGYETPLHGLPLLIEVDGRPQYGAMLWSPLSSSSCRLPQFWSLTLENRLIMGGWYYSADGDTVYRENNDPEVRRVLLELGKLSEVCNEH